MILDSSAVVAVLRREPGHEGLQAKFEAAGALGIGTPSLVETTMVLVGIFGQPGRAGLSLFLEEEGVVAVPFDERHWQVAAQAFLRYGKGRHEAGLNYGDCMSYATAVVADAPLLFVGEDFVRTDVEVA